MKTILGLTFLLCAGVSLAQASYEPLVFCTCGGGQSSATEDELTLEIVTQTPFYLDGKFKYYGQPKRAVVMKFHNDLEAAPQSAWDSCYKAIEMNPTCPQKN